MTDQTSATDGPSRREPQPLKEAALRPTTYGVERPASGFDTILTLNRDRWRIDPHAALRLMEMLVQQLCARLPSVHDLESIEDLKTRAEHAEAVIGFQEEIRAERDAARAQLQTALREREEAIGEAEKTLHCLDALSTALVGEKEHLLTELLQRVTSLTEAEAALAAVQQQLEQVQKARHSFRRATKAAGTPTEKLDRIQEYIDCEWVCPPDLAQWAVDELGKQAADLLALRQQLGQARRFLPDDVQQELDKFHAEMATRLPRETPQEQRRKRAFIEGYKEGWYAGRKSEDKTLPLVTTAQQKWEEYSEPEQGPEELAARLPAPHPENNMSEHSSVTDPDRRAMDNIPEFEEETEYDRLKAQYGRLKAKDEAPLRLVQRLANVYTVETDQVALIQLVQEAKELLTTAPHDCTKS